MSSSASTQRALQDDPGAPGSPPDLFKGTAVQIYFHNNTKTSFALFTLILSSMDSGGFFPEVIVAMDRMQKQRESSCFLLGQTLKRFVRMSANAPFLTSFLFFQKSLFFIKNIQINLYRLILNKLIF